MQKILVVDDSKFQRNFIINTLRNQGYTIAEAKNGIEALQLISEFSPDCILLDLLMPEKDGFAVLSEMNANGKKIPIIIISADIQESTKKWCTEKGAFAFLNKPPKSDEMIKSINLALKKG